MKAEWTKRAILVGAAVLAICTNGVWAQTPAARPAAPAGKVAAVVNGENIPEEEIEQVTNMVIKDRFKIQQQPTDQQRHEIRMEVVSMAIDDVLMRHFLTTCDIKVAPAEIDKHVAELVTSLREAKPPKTLQEFLRETNQTEAQLRQNLHTMLCWTEYVKTRINEAEVRKYYEQNREFFDKVQVRASHILIRLAPNASEAERQAATQKLQALRADIVAGKLDFAEAAKKNSQCPTGPGGGDLGFFSRKFMLPEQLSKVAFELQVGAVSEIVTTELGLHIVKVTDRKKGEASDFEKMKDDVRDYYVEELRQQILAQERKNAKIEVH
jgi:PPIC-type PPIASE domain/SurA N-terminal domain